MNYLIFQLNLAKVNSLLEKAESLLSSVQNEACTVSNSNIRMLAGLINTYTNLRGRLVSALSN